MPDQHMVKTHKPRTTMCIKDAQCIQQVKDVMLRVQPQTQQVVLVKAHSIDGCPARLLQCGCLSDAETAHRSFRLLWFRSLFVSLLFEHASKA